jgi:hypothetical protein
MPTTKAVKNKRPKGPKTSPEKLEELARNLTNGGPVKCLTPSEFSEQLFSVYRITRSEKWVRAKCNGREIFTLPAFSNHLIPETELDRLVLEGLQ